MKRNLSVTVVFCFALSNLCPAWATEVVQVPPIVVQPYNASQLDEQMLEQDRINRDQEFVIKGLIDDNQRLANGTPALKEDATLRAVNQTMDNYRDRLLSRDRARILANSQGRYDDLIKLTEDVDNTKGFKNTLLMKADAIEQKYKTLVELKDAMLALNDKLSRQQTAKAAVRISADQQEKIQLLTQRLAEMDRRIAKYDDIISEKNRQIAQLEKRVNMLQQEVKERDKIIQEQQDRLAALGGHLQGTPKLALPPIIVNKKNQPAAQNMGPAIERLQQEIKAKDKIINENQVRMDQLSQQLKNRTAARQANPALAVKLQNEISAKNKIIKEDQDNLDLLKDELEQKISALKSLKTQADDMLKATLQWKDKSAAFEAVKNQVKDLREKVAAQDKELKTKDDSLRWLNQVLATTRTKAKYYQLTSQQGTVSMDNVRSEVTEMKNDLERRFKNYKQLQFSVTSLKGQVDSLNAQLRAKQDQVDGLKDALNQKINQADADNRRHAQLEKDLASQLKQSRHELLQMQANDDRIQLAKQLIDLQAQEAALLQEKSTLEAGQKDVYGKRIDQMQLKLQQFINDQHLKSMDWQSRLDTLRAQLDQKGQEIESLKTQLKEKISQEQNQVVLDNQIHDLKSRLRDRESRIAALKTALTSGAQTQSQLDLLKQQVNDQQQSIAPLQQELEAKIAESNKLTLMVSGYQKKLEAKDLAYNRQTQQLMSLRDYQGRMEKQIADLHDRLRQKETEIAAVKNQMEELQQASEARDLTVSMEQEKSSDRRVHAYELKINALQSSTVKQLQQITALRSQLALARQQLAGMPSSDEIQFLRSGLEKADAELKQKDGMLMEAKANADEYDKKFKEQSRQFQSLKEQLAEAQEKIQNQGEDLKYKNMEVIRLREMAKGNEQALKAQVVNLTRELAAAEKGLAAKTHDGKIEALPSSDEAVNDLKEQVALLSQRLDTARKELAQKDHGARVRDLEEQLDRAHHTIGDLQKRLDQMIDASQSNTAAKKLSQAVEKVDQQGKIINVLIKKLQECGTSVDLRKTMQMIQ